MVSLSIFFLVSILVFNLYPGTVLSLRKTEQRGRADRIAQLALNQARDRAFSKLVPGTSTAYQGDYDGTHFRWEVAVQKVPDADDRRLKLVRVGVYWTERNDVRSNIHQVYVANVSR